MTQLTLSKNSMLQVPEVQGRLNDTERMVASAGVNGKALRDMNRDEIVQIGTILMEGIARDIGLRKYGEDDATTLVSVVRKHYGRFTASDVKMAFELSMTGDLDDFLPKNSHGEPDTKHFQMLSKEYLIRIFRAYSRYRSKTWCKVQMSLPEAKKEVSKEELDAIRQRFKDNVVKCFRDYRDRNKIPNFFPRLLLLRLLEQNGYLIDIEVTDKMRESAYVKSYLNHRLSNYVKQAEQNLFHNGRLGTVTERNLATLIEEEQIKRGFDLLIEQGLDIEIMFKNGWDDEN